MAAEASATEVISVGVGRINAARFQDVLARPRGGREEVRATVPHAMSLDLQKIRDDKRRLRRDLAARPIEEKLLDALRERELAIGGRAAGPTSRAALHETPPSYRDGTK